MSDRRWQKIALVLKTSAYLCGRQEVIPVDTLIIRHCLWTLADNRKPIEEIIENCVKDFGVANKGELNIWLSEYNDLNSGVNETFFLTNNIYSVEEINGEACFSFTAEVPTAFNGHKTIRFYVPVEKLGKKGDFFVLDEDGAKDYRLKCSFNGGEICTVNIDVANKRNGWHYEHRTDSFEELLKIAPQIEMKKGTQKSVHDRTKNTFKTACTELLATIETIISNTKEYMIEQTKQNVTPFIPEDKRKIVLTALESYLQELEQHKLNAEHLLAKVNRYAASK